MIYGVEIEQNIKEKISKLKTDLDSIEYLRKQIQDIEVANPTGSRNEKKCFYLTTNHGTFISSITITVEEVELMLQRRIDNYISSLQSSAMELLEIIEKEIQK